MAATAASVPSSTTGLSTFNPTPSFSALSALMIWSPKPGHTTTGVPFARDSVKLFCPPCVRKTLTPSASTRCCGKLGAHTAFAGSCKSGPRGSSWTPNETTKSTLSSLPKVSRAPPQAARQSSQPVRLPATPDCPCQPLTGWLEVRSVPILTRTTSLPAFLASFTRRSTSACAPSMTCAAPGSAGASSSSGPTYLKWVPRSL
mmetsp:Transcript_115444/g.337633  ORF Transcript_115444/g.337633 Transcript_115444/m.337633 type:complete len:202 (+) Transcript_115444:437-1042(+)